MDTRRVLILCEQGLLWRGIQSLLESDARLEIIGITNDPVRAGELLQELKPDVLMVDQAHFPLSVGPAHAQRMLDPPPVLVTLDEGDNRIHIHHIEGRALTSPDELIQALVT